MTVRVATAADEGAVLEMGRRFIATTAYAGVLSVEPCYQQALFATLLTQGGCWVLEADNGQAVGMLGLVLAPLPLTGELAALECMWWVEPEHRGGRGGLLMWRHAEAWAREHGATGIQMLQPVAQPRLASLYRRRGYVPVETAWWKRLAA